MKNCLTRVCASIKSLRKSFVSHDAHNDPLLEFSEKSLVFESFFEALSGSSTSEYFRFFEPERFKLDGEALRKSNESLLGTIFLLELIIESKSILK